MITNTYLGCSHRQAQCPISHTVEMSQDAESVNHLVSCTGAYAKDLNLEGIFMPSSPHALIIWLNTASSVDVIKVHA